MFKKPFTKLTKAVEIITVTFWFTFFCFGGIITCIILSIIYFSTSVWWLSVLYMIWMFIDRNTHLNGGRTIERVRDWSIWHHFNNYFPIKLYKSENCQLKSNLNYIFTCFPHGIYPLAVYGGFNTNLNQFKKLYPNHKRQFVTLNITFYFPIVREFILALGGIGASKESIKKVINNDHGGNILLIAPGGAEEAFYSFPNNYNLVLKNRKGFVKIALETGSSLVPVYMFGVNDSLEQFDIPFLKKFQQIIKKIFGFAPIFLKSLVPKRKPCTIVVGDPIEVKKIKNPTKEEVDKLHQVFTEKLVQLFESNKKYYIKNYENVHLNIVE